MENESRILTNQELADALKVTFVFSTLSNIIDNDEDPESGEKIGQILSTTFLDQILANSMENIIFDKEEFDIDAALGVIMAEIESDFDGLVDWSDEYFKGLDQGMKIRILSVVYRTLLLDGKYSENESKFFDEALASSGITLEDINKFIESSVDWNSLSNLTEEEDFE